MSESPAEKPESGVRPMPGFPDLRASSHPSDATVVNPLAASAGAVGAMGSPNGGSPHADLVELRSSVWPRLFPSQSDVDSEQDLGPEGLELDHFKIEERIGHGGMGAVFRAVDQRLKRTVALKVLSPVQSRDWAVVQRFQNEARAAARLDHDNIARVFYIGEDKGLQFIAFEHITGTNLREMIRARGRIGIADAVNYALQIANAFRHVAAVGIVHRDVKPSNIIITPSGRAKLVDLGLARKPRDDDDDSQGELTVAGTTLGTFDYISPEQAKDPRKVDVRSDIYSLGCTLYHMLTGEPPYPEGTLLKKLLDHQSAPEPDPRARNPRVPVPLAAIVRRMMAGDPKKRYQSPEQLINDLMRLALELGLRANNPDGLVWTSSNGAGRRFLERNLAWMTTVSALIAIVLGLHFFPEIGQPGAQPSGDRSAAGTSSTHGAGASSSIAESSRDGGRATGADSRITASSDDSASFPKIGPGSPLTQTDADRRNVAEDMGTGAAPAPFGDEELRPIAGDLKIGDVPPTPADEKATVEKTAAKSTDVEKPIVAGNSQPGGASPNVDSAADNADDEGTLTGAAGANPSAIVDENPRPPLRPVPLKPPDPITVVAFDGSESTAYPTLEAACAEAKDDDIIELRYDGARRGALEKPVRIVRKKVTIRAGKDFSGRRYRPVIAFDAGPASGRMQMMSLIGGSLEMLNVDVEMTVRDTARSGAWSLFAFDGAESIRLAGVRLTVQNPNQREVAVVGVGGRAGGGLARMDREKNGAGGVQHEFDVQVRDSFIRAGDECHLFSVRHAEPGRFNVENSAVAVGGSLLFVHGGLDMPPEGVDLEVELHHVSALTGGNLLHIDVGSFEPRDFLPIHAVATNSVFSSTVVGPLVYMTGDSDVPGFRNRFRWQGDRNYYDDRSTGDEFRSFWVVESTSDSTSFGALDFDGWKTYWSNTPDAGESGAFNGRIPWQSARMPDRVGSASDLEIDEFQLDRKAKNNPAVSGATDGSDAGADLSSLPKPVERENNSLDQPTAPEPGMIPSKRPIEPRRQRLDDGDRSQTAAAPPTSAPAISAEDDGAPLVPTPAPVPSSIPDPDAIEDVRN